MLIVCPNCRKRFEINDACAADDKKLRCSSCRAVFRLVRRTPAQTADAQAPAPQAPQTAAQQVPAPLAPVQVLAPADQPDRAGRADVVAPLAPASTMVRPHPAAPIATGTPVVGRLKVVIANESLPFCDAVGKVLADEPFELFICTDGKQALETVERLRPELLLLDVALPTMFGFEVCERVRQNPALSGVKIILIASIYDKTRYKRSPKSLYGADDYLEKHHIPDSLIPMIQRLVSGSAPAPTAPSHGELVLQERSRTELRLAEVTQIQAVREARVTSAQTELSEAQLKARRLARIIVSDISLYSQGKVEQGVREGNFYTLLADDIREGELFYRQRVPETVREADSYLKEAFEDLIAKKRAELGV